MYDTEKKEWINIGEPQATLYIATEQDLSEVQTMMIAFLSGVDEEHLLTGMYEEGEWERAMHAVDLLKQGKVYFEALPDFSLQDIENVIKKNIRDNDIKYVFHDYIHTSMKILEEITRRSGGVKLREDNILFMISVRLPKLRAMLSQAMPEKWRNSYLPILRRVRGTLWGWLKAQLTLSGLCFFLVCTGLLILGVDYAPVWALVIALVDAIPVLGTGTILIPWALAGLLQGNHVFSLGLLGIYLCAMLSRTVLEPRLVGKHLGIDPLMTLIALYIGYRIWGFGGMLLSPLLCAAATELTHFSQ
jgi:sporulation integral membrane protein YtvI